MAEVTEKEIIKLPSYKFIWKHDNRIYILFDKILPAPVSLSGFGYAAGSAVIIFLFDRLFGHPNFVFGNEFASIGVKFVFLPWLIARVLKYNTLDGKMLLAFARDYVIFFLARGKRYELFRDVTAAHQKEEQGYRIRWRCGYRHRITVKKKGKTA